MRRRKIRTSLSFPPVLDMSPYVDTSDEAATDGGCEYELCAITVHKGTAMGGHYIAFGRNDGCVPQTSPQIPASTVEDTNIPQRNSHWVCFNDANVHVLTGEEAQNLFTTATASSTSSEGEQAPAPPSASHEVLGSTYGVDKDAYLLIYRRRDPPASEAETSAVSDGKSPLSNLSGQNACIMSLSSTADSFSHLEASVPKDMVDRMNAEISLERLLLDVCSVHSSILEVDVYFLVWRVQC